LDRDKRATLGAWAIGEAECDRFDHALYQDVERLSLGLAAAQFGTLATKYPSSSCSTITVNGSERLAMILDYMRQNEVPIAT